MLYPPRGASGWSDGIPESNACFAQGAELHAPFRYLFLSILYDVIRLTTRFLPASSGDSSSKPSSAKNLHLLKLTQNAPICLCSHPAHVISLPSTSSAHLLYIPTVLTNASHPMVPSSPLQRSSHPLRPTAPSSHVSSPSTFLHAQLLPRLCNETRSTLAGM